MEKVDVPSQIVVEKEKIGDPAPLGLAAFALTTFVASAHFAGWTQDFSWIGLAFFYGGVAQFAAGMWEFKRNSVFGGTAFTTYGAFWLSVGLLVLLHTLGVVPAGFNVHTALGWKLVGFFIFNIYMTVCSLLMSTAVFAVFALLSFTELCLFIGLLGGPASWITAGGYFGIVTAIAAFYASFAFCFNTLAGRPIVFVGGPMVSFKP